jgi:hypothetical protein
MKIRAKIKGNCEQVIGDLVDMNGEPKLFMLDNNNRMCVFGIYKESIEFLVKGKWRNIIEGVKFIYDNFGTEHIPERLFEYYKEKVREYEERAIGK